jgi:transposase
MSCTHQVDEYKSVYKYDDCETGQPIYEDEWTSRWTTVDLDTHRYKCTQCGKVMYYSGSAKAFYEKGEGELLS